MRRALLAIALASCTTSAAKAAEPDALERTVAAMARVGSASSPQLTPDAATLFLVTNISGSPQIWRVPSAGGWPEQVTALDDAVSGFALSPDGRSLAFTVAPGGGLNEQVYLVKPDGTSLERITEGGEVNHRLYTWSRDGSRLLFGSNKRDASAIDGYVYDPKSRTSRLVVKGQGIGSFSDVAPDGARALWSRVVSRGDSNLYLVDLSTGAETLLTPHEGPGSFSGELSADGGTVYLAHNKDRDLRAFGRVRLAKGAAPGPIETLRSREDAELDGFALDKQGRLAALVWNAAGRSELELYDLVSGSTAATPRLPGDIAGGLEFSKDGKLLALSISGSAAPSDVYILDIASGSLRQVTKSPHAGVDLATLVRPELLRWKAEDGLALSGWFYRPAAGTPPYPTVLSFHGGPEGQERPAFRADYQALLSRGIAVFAPNVRGSSGFGKRFVNLDNGERRFAGVKDIAASVDAAVKEGLADRHRLGIMGGSYGGYMVMAGITDYPDLFAAGANLFGVVNFETFFAHTQPWMAAISTVEYGDPKTQRDLLRRLSPIHRLDRVKTPTLVLHGANDTNVPLVEAEQVVENLERRGVPVESIIFPDEGHGWRKTSNRVRSTVAITRWFERYLSRTAGTEASAGRPHP